MARIWLKYLPQLGERVATLETAAVALADGTLTKLGREEASSQAHKLAGVLGTFGLHEGTVLAREAEAAYLVDPQTDPEVVARLGEVAQKLRAMLSTHK
jgi:HPt (histidine-containing phosphotransfer) domain-containing protein